MAAAALAACWSPTAASNGCRSEPSGTGEAGVCFVTAAAAAAVLCCSAAAAAASGFASRAALGGSAAASSRLASLHNGAQSPTRLPR